jgi:O-Antigen ligase
MNARRSPVDFWEWARAVLLAANLVWTTLCLGGFLPGTKVVTYSLTGLLLAVHLLEPGRPARAHAAGWLLAPFLGYAALNVGWVTPVRWLGWSDWLGWAQAIAVFWVVLNGLRSDGCRRFVFGVLATIGVTAAALACYQHFAKPDWLMLHRVQANQFIGRSSGPFGIPNSLAAFMLLLIPPAAAMAFDRRQGAPVRTAAAGALLAFAVGLVLAISRGAWFALAAACVLWPLLKSGRGLGRRLASSGIAAAAAIALGAALYAGSPAMRARVDQMVLDAGERTRPIMWLGAWRIFLAHPWFGGGGGSFDTLFEAYRPVTYRDQPVWAHNDYINTLADYGAAGFLLLMGGIAFMILRCRSGSRDPRQRPLPAAIELGLLAFAIQLFFEFHLKLPALAMAMATLAALVVGDAWPGADRETADPPRAERGRVPARLAAVAASVLVLWATVRWVIPRFRAEGIRRANREQIDRMAVSGADAATLGPVIASMRAQFGHAAEIDPSNPQTWSDLAYADSLSALAEPARTNEFGRDAERDATRALTLCNAVPEFWVRKGTGLDMQGRWIEGGDCFAHALELAPARADIWYYQAYHLSLDPRQSDLALAAAAYCLRLDPEYRMAHELAQRLKNGNSNRP